MTSGGPELVCPEPVEGSKGGRLALFMPPARPGAGGPTWMIPRSGRTLIAKRRREGMPDFPAAYNGGPINPPAGSFVSAGSLAGHTADCIRHSCLRQRRRAHIRCRSTGSRPSAETEEILYVRPDSAALRRRSGHVAPATSHKMLFCPRAGQAASPRRLLLRQAAADTCRYAAQPAARQCPQSSTLSKC